MVSVTPAQGATNVTVSTPVTATFSVEMSSSSISTSTFTLTGPGGTSVAGAVAYSSKTATFTPTVALSYSTTYTATITSGARTPGGAALIGPYVWSFTTITPPPVVVSTLPANGATNVPIGQVVSATFNEAMTTSTINTATFSLIGPGGPVAGSVSYSGTVATFTPTANLAYNATYTATISVGAQSLAGTPMASSYVWSFTTITPAPAVVSVTPISGATNVPIAQTLSATFSEAMNSSTIGASTFTVTAPGGIAVAGTVAYSGLVATFTPAANLANSTVYTATVTTGATSVAGTPLAANYVWTFTTIAPIPAVISTVPVNTATGVPVNQVLSATFNEPINCTSLPFTAFTVVAAPGATSVPGTIGCSGAVATFTPATTLAYNTVFTATISTGVTNLAGTPLAANYVWSFRTVPAPTLPTVISTVPTNGATGVPINQALSATFSEAMNPATIGATTFTLKATAGASVTGVVTYTAAGSIATFTPAANLTPTTQYTATITTGAQDLAGNALSTNYTWTFTTAATPLAVPPTVIATVPLGLATGVPFNQIVSATFSTAMDPATINSTTFTLTGPGATSVSGLVAYAAIGNTLTFTPTANLAASTTFTATITTGAKNLAGTPLAANYVWTFTTGSAPAVISPKLVTTVPANAAASIPLNQAVSGTFSEAMNPLTITTATFTLVGPGGVAVAGTVSYDAINFIATFAPTAPLTASTTYIATITSGATDLAGNPLVNTGAPNPWSFTTGAALVPPPVVLGPTIALFGGFGGGAGMTNQGTSTVINGAIGTTGASTTMTGFYDKSVAAVAGVYPCSYTVTPSNLGLVNGAIDTAPPPPSGACSSEGTATTMAIATQAALEALPR
ncbi:MAG: Ig-like domain-containing protein [Terracidiphilus sp.]|nr:Ig-like domain-containing protein [Terracidiphilus sp.]